LNSALQCLSHTPELTRFFVSDAYKEDINRNNPLGTGGRLADSFSNLIKQLWFEQVSFINPKNFQDSLSQFAPQFSGLNQHDSQELLAYLLDGIHEDLNRVRNKPYVTYKDNDGSIPEEEYAVYAWQNHLRRNQSIVVDKFQGQFRSCLRCSVCNFESVTFDPFMYVSIPVPKTDVRVLNIFYLSSDFDLSLHRVPVELNFNFNDLRASLSEAIGAPLDPGLKFADINVRSCSYYKIYYDADDVSKIQPKDITLAFVPIKIELPETEEVVRREIRCCSFGVQVEKESIFPIFFSVPIVRRDLYDVYVLPSEQIFNALSSYISKLEPSGLSSDQNVSQNLTGHSTVTVQVASSSATPMLLPESGIAEVRFLEPKNCLKARLSVHAHLRSKVIDHSKSLKKCQVTLQDCLDLFVQSEDLKEDDAWFCSKCKSHVPASKKMELWRVPDVLIIHLKRFSKQASSFSFSMLPCSPPAGSKIEEFVDFPVKDLDVTPYLSSSSSKLCFGPSVPKYHLYAVINHMGRANFGHYTSFAHDGEGWKHFDDDKVSPVSDEAHLVNKSAYVLFYRRDSDLPK
jgi:ubiquitin carboxyl-terminal hydrolase 4/11/15